MPTTKTPFRGSVLLRLALARGAEPLNQTALALQLGVSQQAVSRWVTGRSRPRLEAILELERLYAIEPRDWFDRPAGRPAASAKGVA